LIVISQSDYFFVIILDIKLGLLQYEVIQLRNNNNTFKNICTAVVLGIIALVVTFGILMNNEKEKTMRAYQDGFNHRPKSMFEHLSEFLFGGVVGFNHQIGR